MKEIKISEKMKMMNKEKMKIQNKKENQRNQNQKEKIPSQLEKLKKNQNVKINDLYGFIIHLFFSYDQLLTHVKINKKKIIKISFRSIFTFYMYF